MSLVDNAFFLKLKPWLGAGSTAFCIVLLLNLFFLKFAYVPAPDMQPALKTGDLILLNKWSAIERNNIIAFYDPTDSLPKRNGALFMQRCVALPGDFLKIEEGDLFVNDKKNEDHIPLQFNYHIKTRNYPLDSIMEQKFGVMEGGKISDEFDYSYSLTESVADSLLRNPRILEVARKVEKKDVRDDEIFPHHIHYKWNKYYMAPLLIPKKGSTLLLDTTNINLYKKLITVYEENKLEIKGDNIIINNKPTIRYDVKQDYYFVMGDNRDNAIDSRYWGFLPESSVVGKLSMVIKRKHK
jgi:signal peptidase I